MTHLFEMAPQGLPATTWCARTVVLAVAAALLLSGQRSAVLGQGLATGFVGVKGCSAASCHGQGRSERFSQPLDSWQNEYTVWATADPHHRAGEVLLAPQGLAMARVYFRQDAKVWGELSDAQRQICANCHATPTADSAVVSADPREGEEGASNSAIRVADGVSCESCHGAASTWLSVHARAEWPGLRPGYTASGALVDLALLDRRANACVGCHVGDSQRQVDHALIAAGHPALNFEFASYFARLPRHWNEKPTLRTSDFEARVWIVGQAATADAAAKLLSARLRAPSGVGPDESPGMAWPELAEYDCLTCHRTIGGTEPSAVAPEGDMQWSTWYFDGLRVAASLPQFATAETRLTADIAPLRRMLNEDFLPRAEHHNAAARLENTARALLEQSRTATISQSDVQALIERAVEVSRPRWSDAVQRFLALRSLHYAALDQATVSPCSGPEMKALERFLRLPDGSGLPVDYDAGRAEVLLRSVAPSGSAMPFPER